MIVSRQGIREDIPKLFGETVDRLNIVATINLTYNGSVLVREGLGYVRFGVVDFHNHVDIVHSLWEGTDQTMERRKHLKPISEKSAMQKLIRYKQRVTLFLQTKSSLKAIDQIGLL